MKKNSGHKFLKNSFVCIAALTAAGLLGACSSKQNVKWDYEADVVVIGAGGAGLPSRKQESKILQIFIFLTTHAHHLIHALMTANTHVL